MRSGRARKEDIDAKFIFMFAERDYERLRGCNCRRITYEKEVSQLEVLKLSSGNSAKSTSRYKYLLMATVQ